MNEKIRQDRERNQELISAAMQQDIARSGKSAHQVAMELSLSDAELDDDGSRSLAQLYKILKGTRKYPDGRWGDWRVATRGTAAIQEICRQAGGVFYDLPGDDEQSEEIIVVCLFEFAEFAKEAAASLLQKSEGGEVVTYAEAERVEREAFQSIRATLHLVQKYNADASRIMSPYAATLTEAVLIDEKGR